MKHVWTEFGMMVGFEGFELARDLRRCRTSDAPTFPADLFQGLFKYPNS
jgi:hypothetical protein